jgi:hypothetical protein
MCVVLLYVLILRPKKDKGRPMKILPTIMPKKWFNDELDSEIFLDSKLCLFSPFATNVYTRKIHETIQVLT